MTAGYYDLDLQLTLESPFMLSGLGARTYGIDMAPLRDDDGTLLMPGSQVRGVLRHGMKVHDPARLAGLFGNGGNVETDPEAMGCLIFDDLHATSKPAAGTITRVAIDSDTGAAKDGHLLTLELPAAVGAPITFKGLVRVRADNAAEAKAVGKSLEEALGYVVAIGKFKTSGYGRLATYEVREPTLFRAFKPASIPAGGSDGAVGRHWAYKFSVDRPLLVDTDYVEQNFLRSSDRIPGGLLKGALARQLAHAGEPVAGGGPLATALSRLVIGHANPLLQVEGTAKALDGRKRDGQLQLEHTVRMHVGIDSGTGAAWEGQLFSQSAIKPTFRGAPLTWLSRLHWPPGASLEEEQALATILATLAAGLVTLGKTSAAMTGARMAAAIAPAVPSSNRWRIELTTPCLMLRTRYLQSEAHLRKALQKYWWEMSNGLLCLAQDEDGEPQFWAKQSLRGGFALVRFAPYGGTKVEPFVLTQPGSVFIVEATSDDEEARKLLEGWSAAGLPAACWDERCSVKKEPPTRYDNVPFLPENGYGAILVNPEASQ